MYKLTFPGQAEVFFESFDVAFVHLIKRENIGRKGHYIRENVENGNGVYTRNFTFEKVKI